MNSKSNSCRKEAQRAQTGSNRETRQTHERGSPERVPDDSPGQRPGLGAQRESSSPERAEQQFLPGVENEQVSPLRGLNSREPRYPGRCPGLSYLAPLGLTPSHLRRMGNERQG